MSILITDTETEVHRALLLRAQAKSRRRRPLSLMLLGEFVLYVTTSTSPYLQL
jgi:hypothetical protein